MFITNESMQILKAGKATVSGSYKVGQVVTFKCGDGSTQKAKCTHAFYANANMPVGEFKSLYNYLIALPSFPNEKGFCHPTILVSAIDEKDAVSIARHLKPGKNIGDIKQVAY